MTSTTTIDWVRGEVNTGSSSTYNYTQHSCNAGSCGEGSNVPLGGPTYYVNTTNSIANQPQQYVTQDSSAPHGSCLAQDDIRLQSCVDPAACPNIGGIQSQVQWSNNLYSHQTVTSSEDYRNSKVACLYPLATFNELEYVQQFANSFPSQVADINSDYNQLILPNFCLSQTNSCPINPGTDQPMTACSRFVSTDADDPCPAWLARFPVASDSNNPSAVSSDGLKGSYCRANNTADCDCINRINNPVYQVMKVGNNIQNDTCWWAPCQDSVTDPAAYLVPSNLPPCDSTGIQQCNNVNIVIGGNSSNLTFDPTQYTDCQVGYNQGTPPNNGGGGGSTTTSSIWSQWWWLIILVTIVIAIIVMLIVILL